MTTLCEKFPDISYNEKCINSKQKFLMKIPNSGPEYVGKKYDEKMLII